MVRFLSGLTSQGTRRAARRPAGSVDDGPIERREDGAQGGGTDADPGSERSAAEVLAQIDRMMVHVVALVGEAIAGATHALLAGDREAAKHLMARDDLVDEQITAITALTQHRLVAGQGTQAERAELVAVLRMLPDLDRNGDLAAHIARRAARGLGAEMSPRSRGLVERMGEVASAIWSSTADAVSDRSVQAANVVDALDDEMDELHVGLTAELATGTMPVPVAIELAMIGRFYERFGDHAVSLARRMSALGKDGAPEPRRSAAD